MANEELGRQIVEKYREAVAPLIGVGTFRDELSGALEVVLDGFNLQQTKLSMNSKLNAAIDYSKFLNNRVRVHLALMKEGIETNAELLQLVAKFPERKFEGFGIRNMGSRCGDAIIEYLQAQGLYDLKG